MRNNLRGGGRVAVSLAATAALCASTAAITTGPAQSIPPTGDCATAFPVADLVEGQTVDGKTVERGTVPDPFSGEVIGVLEDGIAPGLDMVMMELSSPAIDEFGIWAGMSGSPVYDEATGDLIGAVAYGLNWSASPIAGVTPYEEMDDYMGEAPAPRTIKVDDQDARAIARHSEVAREQAAEGFQQLPMRQGVSGVSAARLEQAAGKKGKKYIHKDSYTMGASARAAEAADMVAGGNLAAAVAYGDITAGGVGTVTSVCEEEVVGFGHPAYFMGDTTMTLHPAAALFVQPGDIFPAFKVANIAGPVGTITDDRLSGISGVFDTLPATMDITSTVSFEARSRTGTTHVSLPEANASMTFFQQLVNHDRVIDGITEGSELQSWTITGDDNGTPFSISHDDRYASRFDITFESPWDLADLVWVLSSLDGVTLDEVTVDGDVNDDSSTWRVRRLEQKLGGAWVELGRRDPAIAKAGKTLKLRAVLTGEDGETRVPLSFAIPQNARGKGGGLEVGGGNSSWSWAGNLNSVDGVATFVENLVRNDAVEGQLFLGGRRTGVERRDVSEPVDKVVNGRKFVEVVVVR